MSRSPAWGKAVRWCLPPRRFAGVRVKVGGRPARKEKGGPCSQHGTALSNPGLGTGAYIVQVTPADSPAKPRRRPASKPAKTPASEKQKATFYLTSDAIRRLGVHAAMTGMDKSSLVESLISDALRRFVVQDRAKTADPAMEVVSAT